MQNSETVEIKGHIIDSNILPKVLDELVDSGVDYEILEFSVGKTHQDESSAQIKIWAESEEILEQALRRVHPYGAAPVDVADVATERAPSDGVLPDGFYSTTNLPTQIRIDGHWIEVEDTEMDCGVVVDPSGPSARTIPMNEVKQGQPVVVGRGGIRVVPLARPRGPKHFEFMSSDVSSEKPKELQVESVASEMRSVKDEGGMIIWVLGPAVIHTGSGPDLAKLVEAGWVQAVFSGNGFATHDIESNLYQTSLGVHLEEGITAERGHEHHIRAINKIRNSGSIAKAVEDGTLTGGVMFSLVSNKVPFVLGGSVRDDGPLPDTVTDILEAQKLMRQHSKGAGLCIVVASMLHGIATGNILPAEVPIVCVDINPSTVTKLMDRGSHQSIGLVTDVGLFIKELRRALT